MVRQDQQHEAIAIRPSSTNDDGESKNSPLCRLVIFSKLPIPGLAKTRMIPALGERGAADLHQELAQHTFDWAHRLQLTKQAQIEVAFTGGSESDLRETFDISFECRPQVEGDLGAKLEAAFSANFDEGSDIVVAVGTDCPELDERSVTNTIALLAKHDVVLGPSSDGGYYLVAMRAPHLELFRNMPWSQESLLTETLRRAHSLGLSTVRLPMLDDVDRPEDLDVWQRAKERTRSPAGIDTDSLPSDDQSISIVIPTLGQPQMLDACLASIERDSSVEIIVVDAKNDPACRFVAKSRGAQWHPSKPGRAYQMNRGAKESSGELILFLHSDTKLPLGFAKQIRKLSSNHDFALGAFRLGIEGQTQALRRIEAWANRRSNWFGLPYGDQAFFLRRKTFEDLHGFKDMEIMEDFDLARRANRIGKICIASSSVITSARRWKTIGPWKTTILNQWIVLCYYLGVSPSRLAKWYGRKSDG